MVTVGMLEQVATEGADTLYKALFDHFPFVTDTDKSGALALFLSMHWRRHYLGGTPLFAIESGPLGVGKTTLLEAIFQACYGPDRRAILPLSIVGRTAGQEELVRAVAQHPECDVVHLYSRFGDTFTLEGAPLVAALTMPWWTYRIPRRPDTYRAPLGRVWVTEGPTHTYSPDLARRTVRIELGPLSNPLPLSKLKHLDFQPGVRAKLANASYAMLFAARELSARAPLPWGGFEGWDELVRGAVHLAGRSVTWRVR